MNESNRLNSAELAALKQLVADREVLNDVQLARLEELQSAKMSAKMRNNESRRLKRRANRVERDTLEQLVADKGEIAPKKQARHDELQSAREKKNESQRLYKQRKRQKRQEEAAIAAESHPMIKLLVNSDGNKHKLIQLVSDGTIKKVLMLYFVSGQKN